MKKAALIYALWDKNLPVLQHYLQGRPRVVIVPSVQASPALRQAVTASGSELFLLPTDGSVRGKEAAVAVLQKMKGGPANIGLSDGDIAANIMIALTHEVANELTIVQGWLDVLESLSQSHEIEITVLNEDVLRDSKALALWSRKNGIPVLQVAHGTGMGRDYIGETCLSDHIAVASQRSAGYFQDLGIGRENIHIVGNPAWDVLPTLVQQRDSVRAQFAQTNDLPTTGTWLLWGSTWNGSLSALDTRDGASQMHQACRVRADLKAMGIDDVTLIYKDRITDGMTVAQAREQFMGIAARYGVADCVRYTCTSGIHWAAASDVVVSYDSNLSIEALLCGVPAINVITPFGAITGGAFGADEGVLAAEGVEVAPVIARLCRDADFRAAAIAAGNARKAFYHNTTVESSAARTAQLIARCARKTASSGFYVWQHLDAASAEFGAAPQSVADIDFGPMYTNEPALILDVGCRQGHSAELIKQRFPGSRAWGIEMNRAAADLAARKLDRVLVGKFEDFDLEQEGIAKGTLDAVLLADTLQRMHNPWDVMVKLRPYMSPKGQILLGVPNVRNLQLAQDLSNGDWTYGASGLLDITHIRFFTFKEILKFCRETGYRVRHTRNAIDTRFQALWQQHQSMTTPTDINLDRITLKNVTRDELLEWCTAQFYVLLENDSQPG